MRKKEFIAINTLIAIMISFFGVLTIKLSINQDMGSLVRDIVTNQSTPSPVASLTETEAKCSKTAPLKLADINDPSINKLDEYQQACGSFATNKLMFFTSFPENKKAAADNSAAMAARLKLFHKAGITPIVVVEPYVGDQLMSYRAFLNGNYDEATSYYFERLKALGVTDEMMGTWVPFPETNTPNWNNADTEPRDFATCVNKYLSRLKKSFPTAKASVLLSAMTYEPSDKEWENGDYISLVPYLQYIDKNLVSSIGIQGFPWVSKATQKPREIVRASEFLQPDLAIAAAQELHTREIWFNTGSFASKYTTEPKDTAQVSITQRKAILSDVIEQVKYLQNYQQNQYRVSVNLFSEDKSSSAEATDWSYFQNNDSKTVLKEFLQSADQQNIPVSLFDKTH